MNGADRPSQVRISEAAEATGVSRATLRVWERRGLIRPARTSSGARVYCEEDLARIRHIQYLRHVEHLNPAAIARVLSDQTAAQVCGPIVESDSPGLGDRLRARRRRANLTLKQVAEKTGLSISFLSTVERGLAGLSISTLQKLTRLYGITVLDLMDDRSHPGRLVRLSERPELPGSRRGVRIQQLALGRLQMEPQVFIIEPGGGSEGAYDHAGEEFILVQRGTLEIWLDETEHYLLNPGDCLYFPSTLPHRWRNPGSQETEVLWVNTPPTF